MNWKNSYGRLWRGREFCKQEEDGYQNPEEDLMYDLEPRYREGGVPRKSSWVGEKHSGEWAGSCSLSVFPEWWFPTKAVRWAGRSFPRLIPLQLPMLLFACGGGGWRSEAREQCVRQMEGRIRISSKSFLHMDEDNLTMTCCPVFNVTHQWLIVLHRRLLVFSVYMQNVSDGYSSVDWVDPILH